MRGIVTFIVLCFVVLGGLLIKKRLFPSVQPASRVVPPDPNRLTPPTFHATGYVLDSDASTLRPVEISGPFGISSDRRVELVVTALARFSNDSANAAAAPLPEGTQLKSVTVEDGLCTLDFNDAFGNRLFWAGAEHEHLALRALVNSVTEIPGVTKVRIKVEGKPVESLGGHEAVTEPLTRDESVLPKAPGARRSS